jgi:sugar O-acyltransferase (sialic acid O-acetyltransferase NeuD family)
MARDWLLFACRTPYAVEVAEVIWRRGEEISALVDNLDEGPAPDAPDPLAVIDAPRVRPDELPKGGSGLATVVPMITPGHRFKVEQEAREAGLSSFPALVDPTAVVGRTVSIGDGCVVGAATVIAGAATIGRFVHVNRSSSIGHHCALADFVTVGPGCVLAGGVRVGRGAFIGAGAACAPEVSIGANALVGAGAVVVRDVAAGAVVAGNPARVMEGRAGGYGGATVPP